MHPDPSSREVVLPRALLVGLELGLVAAAGGSLILYGAAAPPAGAAGYMATLLFSLLVGLWAGAPAAEAEDLPLRDRWVAAGIATALAGAFATVWSLSPALAGGGAGRVIGLLVLVAAPAYAIGMLLPVLLAWGERWEEMLEDAQPGWGALGATVMGVLGGLFLGIPAAALLLVPWLGSGPVFLGAAIALLLPLAFPEPDGPETRERLLHEVESPFGVLRVTERVFPGDRQAERRLYLDDEQESGELVRSGAPTLPYIAAAESWLAATTPPGSSYLFLGGGAYTLPRRVAERDPRARITVVELDPEVTRLAYRFFGLRREHGVASAHGDARAFLQRGDEEYDRIYLDVYGGRESLPYPLVTLEAFAALRRRLRPQGLGAMNLIGVTAGAETLRMWSVVRTVAEAFPAMALYTHLGPDYPERQNVLVVFSPDPDRALPDRAGLFERWPSEQWPEIRGAAIFRDLFTRPTADREQVTGKR